MKRRAVAAIARFLQSEDAVPLQLASADKQSLLDAAACLSKGWALDPSELAGEDLPNIVDVFVAGSKAMGCFPSDFTEEAKKGVASDPASGSGRGIQPKDSGRASASNEAAFAKFLSRLKTTTDFFKEIEEGTPEYEKRVTRARAKFESKLAQKRGAEAPRGDAASTPVARTTAPSSTPATDPERKQRAEALKLEGNSLLKGKDYNGAYEAYGKAIAEDDSNAIYYSNRAAALIHLGRFSEAVSDCDVAIRLDSKFIRARERLASAYRHLGMPDREAEALEKACSIQPENEKLRKDAHAARARANGTGSGLASNGMDDQVAALKRMMQSNQPRSGSETQAPGTDRPSPGQPDFGAMMEAMGGASGMSGMMEQMSSNPAVAQMMNDPGMQEMMRDPNMLQRLAENPQVAAMMQNPELMQSMMQNFSSMLGGGGGPGVGPGGGAA